MTYAPGSAQVTPNHVITINYEGDQPGPDIRTLLVRVRESVAFKQGLVPTGFSMQVTFDHPEHFSASVVREGDAPIVVLSAPAAGYGTYRCELVAEGSHPSQPTNIPGGSLEVDTGQGDVR